MGAYEGPGTAGLREKGYPDVAKLLPVAYPYHSDAVDRIRTRLMDDLEPELSSLDAIRAQSFSSLSISRCRRASSASLHSSNSSFMPQRLLKALKLWHKLDRLSFWQKRMRTPYHH